MRRRDLALPVRQTVLALLKSSDAVTGLVLAQDIYSTVQPNPRWPFIRYGWGATIPGIASGEIVGSVHAFACPRLDASGRAIESGEDHAGRIAEAVVSTLDRHGLRIGRARATVRANLIGVVADREKLGAFQAIVAIRALIAWGDADAPSAD